MPKPSAICLALIVAVNALLSIVATYALLRGYDVLFKSEANPATVIWSAHIAMFWRLGIGAYVAGMVSFATYLLARRNVPRALRVTAVLVPAVGALIAMQSAFLP